MSKIFYMRDDDKFYDELNLKYKDEKTNSKTAIVDTLRNLGD